MAGNYCASCGKMVSLEAPDEAEIGDEQFDGETGAYSFTARIVRTCAECSEEMKEAVLEVEGTFNVEAVLDEHPELSADDLEMAIECEVTERYEGGRRGKTFFGISGKVSVSTGGLSEVLLEEEFSDEIQASHMDDLG